MSDQTVRQEVGILLNSRRSLELASSSSEGMPLASYAPFVYRDGSELCVFLSTLAGHTSNIVENPKVSAMIIEDESACQNIFARERVILDCDARRIERNGEDWNQWLEPYKRKFGAIVDTLVQLADFNLYLLHARCATYVKGFGQAYRLTGAGLSEVTHINPAKESRK